MTRISLRETYDNRSVIAQIAKVTDTAEDAAETVEQKAAEINDAITDVNAAVQAAEGAATTANAASASAQQSAQTVAGYENRLGAVEGDVVQLNTDVDGVESDLNAVTLRVTTAEGQIVTIQGRVTALETADGQNVKINDINNYAVGLTGNQLNIAGNKGFLANLYAAFFRTTGADGYRRLNIDRSDDDLNETPASSVLYPLISWNDKNNTLMSAIYVSHLPNGTTSISVQVRNSDGTIKYSTIAQGDVI